MAETQATDRETQIDQPGLSGLREAVANYAERQLPSRGRLGRDALAGLNSAISSVPDGLASGILAGVNPIYGLYACIAGPIAGGIFSSSQLMIVATTSASALAAGQTLSGLSAADRDSALVLLVLLIGAFQILLGLLRLGRLTRFVSYSVMSGFLAGIAVLTVLSQFPTVTGIESEGGSTLMRTFGLLGDLEQVNWPTLAVAILALVLVILLPRTPLGQYGTLVAIIIPSVVVPLLGLDSVQLVGDVSEIPRGIPGIHLPSFEAFTPDLLTGALAVAAIILVQGAGVSQSVPNPDGSRISASRNFIGQGAANVLSGVFHGLPVGGSLSTTAVTVVSGARTRWAVILAGIWMAVIVIFLPGLVSRVAMPALGALLIFASANAIKPVELLSIWETGLPSRLAVVATFLATLYLPIAAAVGIGTVLSALLYLFESSTDISLVELVKHPDGRIEERKRPRRLESDQVTVLDVYGNLYYAGASTLERLLPRPDGANHPVVVLRMRGRTKVGATLVDVLSNYVEKLQKVNGRLYLTGIGAEVHDQIVRTGKLRLDESVRIYDATPIHGQSTDLAVADARTWLIHLEPDTPPDPAAEEGKSFQDEVT
ncbi:MAG TPA: SulP family inorganic anion transporter [Anaerolineaceae bacterium]|nr:SulP family inorganic anion transporter [Anaerolineaceae bacterium]